jgi:hypothetical protein
MYILGALMALFLLSNHGYSSPTHHPPQWRHEGSSQYVWCVHPELKTCSRLILDNTLGADLTYV